MKKILSLLIVGSLMLGALLLGSCSANSNNGAAGETTTASSEPVIVDSLNGKGAKALFDDFKAIYFDSTDRDLSFRVIGGPADVVEIQSGHVKIDERGNAYTLANMESGITEIHVVDNDCYVSSDGRKIRMTDASIDDIMGDNYMTAMLESIFPDRSDSYSQRLKDLKLYSLDGEYYYTHSYTLEGTAEDLVEETVYFNGEGKLIRVVRTVGGVKTEFTVHSYGVPFTINRPDDAAQYETPLSNEEIYEIYLDILDAVKAAPAISASLFANYGAEMRYESNGEDKHVWIENENGVVEFWQIGGKGYARDADGAIGETELTGELQEYFQSAEQMLQSLTDNVIPYEGILTLQHMPAQNGVIFMVGQDARNGNRYTLVPLGDGKIYVDIQNIADGALAGSVTYEIKIEKETFKIQLPE